MRRMHGRGDPARQRIDQRLRPSAEVNEFTITVAPVRDERILKTEFGQEIPIAVLFEQKRAAIQRETVTPLGDDAPAKAFLDFDQRVGNALAFQFPRRRESGQAATNHHDIRHRQAF